MNPLFTKGEIEGQKEQQISKVIPLMSSRARTEPLVPESESPASEAIMSLFVSFQVRRNRGTSHPEVMSSQLVQRNPVILHSWLYRPVLGTGSRLNIDHRVFSFPNMIFLPPPPLSLSFELFSFKSADFALSLRPGIVSRFATSSWREEPACGEGMSQHPTF